MDRIDQFIKDILDDRGINQADKEDLRLELTDHILLLKNDYINDGLNEDEAIERAIKDFGNTNTIGNGIKRALPSKNRYEEFNLSEIIKIVLAMVLGYMITNVYMVAFQDMIYQPLTYYSFPVIIPIIISFIYINLKLASKMKRVKNIIKALGIFLLVERLLFLMVDAIKLLVYTGGDAVSLTNLLNFKYILTYLCISVVFVGVTSLISDKVIIKLRNPYNSKLITNILLTFSFIFMILYYLFPNRWYILCRFVEEILRSEIVYVDKNILFLTINHELLIPNIGLILLIIMGVKLVKQIYRKGIGSLT